MNWIFELSDCPLDANNPIKAIRYLDNEVKKGPIYLSVENLVKALKAEPDNLLDADGYRSKETSTPSLPFGTIRYSSNESKSKERITMEIPQKNWEIRYGNKEDEFYTIPFPRMVVQYLVVNSGTQSIVNEMRLYAVLNNKEAISDKTELYVFPYPNVGKSNGIVCWGQNQRLEIKALVDLERAFLWFISAPFNEDHGVRTTLGIGNFKRLMQEIENKNFDDDWLMPLNKVFEDIFN